MTTFRSSFRPTPAWPYLEDGEWVDPTPPPIPPRESGPGARFLNTVAALLDYNGVSTARVFGGAFNQMAGTFAAYPAGPPLERPDDLRVVYRQACTWKGKRR